MSEIGLHNAAVPYPEALPSATLSKRLLATLYDWLLVLGLMMLASVPAVAWLGDAIQPGNPLYRLCLALLAAAFFIGFWRHGGQTLGMRAWRLKLVTEHGEAVNYRQAGLRFLAAWLSILPAGLGFWWGIFSKNHACWHDHLSGTRLVLLPKAGPQG